MKSIQVSLLFILAITCTAAAQKNTLESSIKRGAEIYTDFCASCHMPAGEGVPGVFPPLAKSDFLLKKREESIRAIKFGLQGEIIVNGVTYNGVMSSLGLSDDEVADVMNYINNSWSNKDSNMVTEEEVSKIKNK